MSGFTDWIAKYGACILIVLTFIQVCLFVGYSVFYNEISKDWKGDKYELSRW